MNRKSSILVMASICVLILSSCHDDEGNTYIVDLTDDEIKEYEYTESDDVEDALLIDEYEIELDKNTVVCGSTVYDAKLYYIMRDYDVNENTNIIDNLNQSIQLRSYDKESGEDTLLHTIYDSGYLEISEIFCNGSVVAWEEYNYMDDSYSLKYIELEDLDSDLRLFLQS